MIRQTKTITAFLTGVLTAGFIGYVALNTVGTTSNSQHPVGYADSAQEVHVHSDFVVYLDGAQIDLSGDRYQTTAMQTKHAHIHLHDNNDDIIHRHAHDVTLGDFFDSLGFSLTENCITTDTALRYCTNSTDELLVFVNGDLITGPATYENQEEDRILIYYGNPNDPILNELQKQITDKACIYSGTCPERGVAPPEECGLTCVL